MTIRIMRFKILKGMLLLLFLQGFSAQQTMEVDIDCTLQKLLISSETEEDLLVANVMNLSEVGDYFASLTEGFFEGDSPEIKEVWDRRFMNTVAETQSTARLAQYCEPIEPIVTLCAHLHLLDTGDPDCLLDKSCDLDMVLNSCLFSLAAMHRKCVFVIVSDCDMDVLGLLTLKFADQHKVVVPIPHPNDSAENRLKQLGRSLWISRMISCGLDQWSKASFGLIQMLVQGLFENIRSTDDGQQRSQRIFVARKIFEYLSGVNVDGESEGLWGDKFISSLRKNICGFFTLPHCYNVLPMMVQKLFRSAEEIVVGVDQVLDSLRGIFTDVNDMFEHQKRVKRQKEEEEQARREALREMNNPFNLINDWQVYKFFGPVCAADRKALRSPEVIERALQRAKEDVDGAMTIETAADFLKGLATILCGQKQYRLEHWCRDVPTIKLWVKDFLPETATQDQKKFVEICLYLYMSDIESDACYLSMLEPPKALCQELKKLLACYVRAGRCRFMVREEGALDLLGSVDAQTRKAFSFDNLDKRLFYYLEFLEAAKQGESLVFLPNTLEQDGGSLKRFIASMQRDLYVASCVHMDRMSMNAMAVNAHSDFVAGLMQGIQDHWSEEGVQRTQLAYNIVGDMGLYREVDSCCGVRPWKEEFISSMVTRIHTIKELKVDCDDLILFVCEALNGVSADHEMRQQEIALMLERDWGVDLSKGYGLECFIALTKCAVHKICDCNGIGHDREAFLIALEEGIRRKEQSEIVYRRSNRPFVLLNGVMPSCQDLNLNRCVYLMETIESMSFMERAEILLRLSSEYYLVLSNPELCPFFDMLRTQ